MAGRRYAKLTPEKISEMMHDPDTGKLNPPVGLAGKLRQRAQLLEELAEALEQGGVGEDDPLWDVLKANIPAISKGTYPSSEQLAELAKQDHDTHAELLDALRMLVGAQKTAQ